MFFILLLIPLISGSWTKLFSKEDKTSKCSISIEGGDTCSIICGVSEKSKCVIAKGDGMKDFPFCTCLDTPLSLDIKERDKCNSDLKVVTKENTRLKTDLKNKDEQISKLEKEIKKFKEKPKEKQKEKPKEKPKEKDVKK